MIKNSNLKLAKEWIIKSQNDLESAKILFRENGPTDSLCFHCHQTIEKVLKGFLVFSNKEVPKIHDLIRLLNLCKEIDKNLESLEDGVIFLNRYYIETRYPPEIYVYSKKDCEEALSYTEDLSQFVVNEII